MPVFGNRSKGAKKKTEPVASDLQNRLNIGRIADESDISQPEELSGTPRFRKPATTPLNNRSFYAESQDTKHTTAMDRAIQRLADPLGAAVRAADLSGNPRPTDISPGQQARRGKAPPTTQTVLQSPSPEKRTRTRRRTGSTIGVNREDKLG